MKLSIIPVDKTVCVDGVCYAGLTWEGTPIDVHALQWFDAAGWIEFVGQVKPNEDITELPVWAINAQAAWTVANQPKPVLPPTAEENKDAAANLLYITDWATIPDVADPTKSNPYLGNAQQFVVYRNTVRQYVITPVAGDIDWPTKPLAVWVTV
jgi:hypothetical protein